ncbi:MAG: hypothetical protein U0324_12130 [Polyangiales bacterium]
MGVEAFITRCPVCGTQYTARSWYWLEPLAARSTGAVDRRVCAVPGCCNTLARASEVGLALARVGAGAANDTE